MCWDEVENPPLIARILVRRGAGASYGDSLLGCEGAFDLDQNHGHVVVLVGGADEGLDFAENPLPQFAGVQMAVFRDDAAEAGVAEQVALACSWPR